MKLLPALLFLWLGCSTAPSAELPFLENPTLLAQDTPQLFLPGIVSTPEHDEGGIAFGRNNTELFFWRRLPEEKQKIYRSTWDGQTWSTPQVQSFSTDREDDPYLSLDGNTLFFSSERALEGRPNLGNFDTNLWRVSRTGDRWGEPMLVDADFNTVQDKGEEWPSSNAGFVSSLNDSLFYICTMMKGDSAIRLYEYQRLQDESFSRVNQVTGLFENPNIWVHGAVRSPDGNYLVFNSFGAPGGSGGEDLYVSKRLSSGAWSLAKPITLLNTTDEEAGPRFSSDGRTLYFGKAISKGNYAYEPWNIMHINTAALGFERMFE